MSVDEPEQIHLHTDKDLLSAAACYQAGLPTFSYMRRIFNDDKQYVGSFILRHVVLLNEYPYVLCLIKTKSSFVEHVLNERFTKSVLSFQVVLIIHTFLLMISFI